MGAEKTPMLALKYYMPKARRVLRKSSLHKIDVHRIITKLGSWELKIGNLEIGLVPERFGGDFYLQLFVDYIRQPKRWLLSSRSIRGRLHHGGFIPWDKSEVWYVGGSNGKRYRHLYIHPEQFRIGTREEFGAWYDCDCYSDKQRAFAREKRKIRQQGMHNKSEGQEGRPVRVLFYGSQKN